VSAASRRWVATGVLVLALFGAIDAATLIRLHILFTQAQTEISYWGRANYQPDEKAQHSVHLALQTLLRANPHHPDYLSLQASELSWLSYWQRDQSESQRLARAALSAQQSALVSRPAHRHSQAKMLEYEARVQRTKN